MRQTTKSETQTSGESGLKVLVVERNGFAGGERIENLYAAGGAAGNNFYKSGFRSGIRPGGSRFLFIADYTNLSDGQAFRSSPAISPRISR